MVQSQAFVGSVSATAAVAVVGVVVGIAWYAGAFSGVGVGARHGADTPVGASSGQAGHDGAAVAASSSSKVASSIAARRTTFPGNPHVSTCGPVVSGVGVGAPERTPAVLGNGQAAGSAALDAAAAGVGVGTGRSPAARHKGVTPTGERRV
jgi:hypothetical protein